MKDVQIGDELYTWIKPKDREDMPIVKKVKVKDIFTIMVTADVNGSGWSVDVSRDNLYETQGEAMEALQKELDRTQK